MKTWLGLSCAVLAVFIAGEAFARGPAMAGAKKRAGGFYLGGSAGTAKVNLSDDLADFDYDADELGYKVFAGYSAAMSSSFDLGVEGSYVDFGRFTSSSSVAQSLECRAWDLFGVGTMRFGGLGVFGKVGSAWWSHEIDDFEDITSGFGDNFAYGVGVELQLDAIAIRTEYERFDVDAANVDFLSLGASLLF